ncbi:MAG: hypothetical protein JXN59_16020 [Anaerolineae bacterium]|nr:hypothetical protein [Anaerolineae bacterium]
MDKKDQYLKVLGIISPHRNKDVFDKQVYIAYYLLDETHVLSGWFLFALESKAEEWKKDLNPLSIDSGKRATILQQSTYQIYDVARKIGLVDIPMPDSPDRVLAIVQPIHEQEGINGVKHTLVEEAYNNLRPSRSALSSDLSKVSIGVVIRAIFSRFLNNYENTEKLALNSMSDLISNYKNLISILREIENQVLADGTTFSIGLEERIRDFYPPFLK